MALLDEANTSKYGNPEITSVNIGVRNNPAILISGHDLTDLEQLLEQTKGTGVDVYTHSEMLPAHYYPAFKKYDNFVGNYGNAWWKQLEEFETFKGAILFTTNCIVPPKSEEIRNRIFTTGSCGYPECKHIEADENGKKDFSEVIELAKKLPSPQEIETGSIVGGFAHNQVFALADKVVEAVKSGCLPIILFGANIEIYKNYDLQFYHILKTLSFDIDNTKLIIEHINDDDFRRTMFNLIIDSKLFADLNSGKLQEIEKLEFVK